MFLMFIYFEMYLFKDWYLCINILVVEYLREKKMNVFFIILEISKDDFCVLLLCGDFVI